MTYYIDFDNTIFDTVSFYNDLKNVMHRYGINDDIIDKYQHISCYSPLQLIDDLIEKNAVDESILIDIDKIFDKAEDYLYQDALLFLEKVKTNNKLVLLTYGNKTYQERKINSSKIQDYFNEIIITDKSKASLELEYKNGIFIDDNTDVLQELLIRKPSKLIRIKRVNNPRSNVVINNDFIEEYKDFNEISLR